ncbi:Hypothetical predicted protein [Lecanosticta acicola]|uniref:Uncharacterized protein n=1 Tax=Lecanosticta acicola TaxID=111012 RepID=A0AAI8YU68_9PEZI|nr:Hypothetical predicted protein [Lecanosticta acicola]
MNVQIEDDHSSDEERANLQDTYHSVKKPERLTLEWPTAKDEEVPSEAWDYNVARHRSVRIEAGATKSHETHRHKIRRRPSRKYVEDKSPKPSQDADQDSDDVLDDYYGGAPITSMHIQPAMPGRPLPEFSGGESLYRPLRMRSASRPSPYQSAQPHPLPHSRPSRMHPPPNPFMEYDDGPPSPSAFGPPPSRPLSRPPSMGFMSPPETRLRFSSTPFYRQSYDNRPTRMPDTTTIRVAPPHHTGGLWDRAAVRQLPGVLKLNLKLVLTRKGERYKGRPFSYETHSWDDVDFAHRLRKEYRSLKTEQIGLMQKATSYKTISFIYFLQYHAFQDPGYRSGRWEITDRVPIVPREDEKARSFFMYQFKRRVQKVSKLFSTLSDKKPPPPKRSRDWIRRLEFLIEPGAVIDIEVKETFDSMKIYLGLLLAVLLSLGVALAYGLVKDNDFSTGFSIASWLLTAFGFFAAVVAAGEYLGLESPTATLSAAEELRPGRISRELLDHGMYTQRD